MEEFAAILQKTALFRGIEAEKIIQLCRDLGCYQRTYHKGNFLWQQGENVSCAGVVLSGSVQAEKSGADGSGIIAAHHGTGALFGDILMSSEHTGSPVSIVAAEDTRVLFLPFVNMMREGACAERDALERFRLNLLGEMSEKYWLLHRKIGYLSAHGMRKRLSLWLLDETDESGLVTFSLSREQLAAFLGVNRSALCRELSRMKAEGLIMPKRGSIRILQMKALRRLVE